MQQNYGDSLQRRKAKARGANVPDFRQWKNQTFSTQYNPNDYFDKPQYSISPRMESFINDIKTVNANHRRQQGVDAYKVPNPPKKRTALSVFSAYIFKPIYYKIIEENDNPRKKVSSVY